MLTNYFTLAALAREWQDILVEFSFSGAYSHHRGEITLVFERGEDAYSVRLGTTGPMQFAFGYEGESRPRRNVATFFDEARSRGVVGVRAAHLDRHLFVDLAAGSTLHIVLFGSRANVLLVRDGLVQESFRFGDDLAGTAPPKPRPARLPESGQDIADSLPPDTADLAKALRRAIPLLDATLSAELAAQIIARGQAMPEIIYDEWCRLEARLRQPRPRIVRIAGRHEFSLIELRDEQDVEAFDSVNTAVRVFVRKRLGQIAFESRYDPLLRTIERAAKSAERRAESMADELARPSRADEYERYGHLLMANSQLGTVVETEVTLTDMFEGGTVDIQIDPTLSIVQNAEEYYNRARRVRAKRAASSERFDSEVEQAERMAAVHARVKSISTLKELQAFENEESDLISGLRRRSGDSSESLPYRRILVDGYEVFVGKGAAQNDRLTFGVARKHDLWLHARGVSGSHVVLRVDRGKTVPRPVIERAAAIAAWNSKARGSGLVPVIVTERKFVRKPRGAHPGAVLVDRERVVTVVPASP